MGEYYTDYDEASACWGVFHTDKRPGYCYALFTTQLEAEEWAQEQVLWNAAAETEGTNVLVNKAPCKGERCRRHKGE